MRTIGTVLRESRVKQQRTIEDVADHTKIQKKFLEALEQDQYDVLPSEVVTKGFIKLYARELGMDQDSSLALFRRDFIKVSQGNIIPQELVNPFQTRMPWFRRWRTILVAFLLILLGLGIAFGIAWKKLNQLPNINILEPIEGQIVQQTVVVRGKTETDVTVFVNNKQISIDQHGAFETNVSYDNGEHTITVEIRTRRGGSRLVQRTVHVVD